MLECKICNKNLDSVRSLSKHIRDHHKDNNIKTYYDEYLKKEKEGLCLVCGKNTNFGHLGIGYKETCGKSCSTKLNRKRLRENPEKFNIFVQKISDCVKKEWSTKDQTNRIKNMTNTVKKNISGLSTEEKKKRFGFLNKLSEKDRKIMIEKMTENGFLKWWKNASYEQKREAWNKRNEKLVQLWEKYGEEIHEKQKVTFAKNQKNFKDNFELEEKEIQRIFKNLDKIFL